MASILSQIAEEAGVSVSTVSRVLNGESEYNRPFYAERATRIKAIADKLNYQPNLAARAISTGRFGNIALIASSSGQGGLPPHLMDGIADCASRHQQMVSVARLSPEEFTEAAKLPTILNSSAADGLLINYTHQWPETVRARHRTPRQTRRMAQCQTQTELRALCRPRSRARCLSTPHQFRP